MPTYEIEAPNGQILEIDGDTMPTEQELDDIFKQTNTVNNVQPAQTKEEKIANANAKYQQAIEQADKEWRADTLKNGLGGGLMGASMHPIFNIPYVGTGLGGALYSTGDAISQGKNGLDILKDAGKGFAVGETVGAIPYAGKVVGKTKVGGAVAGAIGKGVTKLANSPVGRAYAKALATKGGQLAKEVITGVGEKLGQESVLANPIRTLNAKLQKLPSYLVPGLKAETVQRAINPNSIALDLTNEEADRLALDTTERLRDAYNTLKAQRGQAVADEALRLSELDNVAIPTEQLKNDVTSIFNQDTYGRVNPSRALEGKTEQELTQMVEPLGDTVSPYELLGLKRQVGDMTNWDIADARNKNRILEQVYGKFNNRLNGISPELAQANQQYAQLYDMLGEKSRLRNILNPKANLETATSALKNYKTTNDNIYQLEDMLVNELGEKPFLNVIDDVNTAKNILNTEPTGINPLGLLQKAKDIAIKPTLFTVRGINRNIYQPIKNAVLEPLDNGASSLIQKLLTPIMLKDDVPLLEGGVQYYENR